MKTLAPYRKVFHQLAISDEDFTLKGDRIVLPTSLHEAAITKAHQGSHPGMTCLKRRLRSHFWFPKMNKLIEEKISSCKECLMFTNKTTHEPIISHTTPTTAWNDVSVDLFGPMPDSKHVLVVLDKMSRYPDAKIVPNTSSKAVIGALNDVYTEYGQPGSHRSDNGPPFNSGDFAQFSKHNDIQHVKTLPYHPQANPAETFMRPLGKAMKTAFYNKTDRQQALNNLLSTYRATPHPSTGVPPGNILFRSGYKKDFPRKELSNQMLVEVQDRNKAQRKAREHRMNISNHRCRSTILPGDIVYTRNMIRNKFQPLFGPELYEVIEISNYGGVFLRSCSGNRSMHRHLDDVKQVSSEPNHTPNLKNNESHWIFDDPPSQHEIQQHIPNQVNQDQPVQLNDLQNGQSTRSHRNTGSPLRYQDYVC